MMMADRDSSRNTLELIDTLWNVNLKAFKALYSQYRINRYIMECKYEGYGVVSS